MRIAVLDVGSTTVNLVVADAESGVPVPVHTWKARTRVAEQVGPDGSVASRGRKRMIAAVREATREITGARVDSLFAYATAVVRDSPDRDEVLAQVEEATGVRLGLLSGVEEAQLTFLAARRWLGWRAGPMLLADIGGGSIELAFGRDRLPESALSLPLGAGRLTREFLSDGDPPSPAAVAGLQRHVRSRIKRIAARTSWEAPATAVAASKTFQQLARLTGAAPQRRGPFVDRELRRRALRPWIERLGALPAERRAELQGVSSHRARQILAGSVVAYEVMRGLRIDSLRICPWGLREGILLRQLEVRRPELESAGWVDWPGREGGRGRTLSVV
ncbi:Ppx/GppA phosphatase family protein [Actinoplanes sp. RD1]|uniref:Ppx/GppA phosphatase family protein n=1 Tax=Actinoplanes sp. RD1 TaxID=3064538 RepID=UPI002740433C|nr:Ppx/GppA family phosphatase [Actinoplanes sp. RD1]